jgi:hypothetical protein
MIKCIGWVGGRREGREEEREKGRKELVPLTQRTITT